MKKHLILIILVLVVGVNFSFAADLDRNKAVSNVETHILAKKKSPNKRAKLPKNTFSQKIIKTFKKVLTGAKKKITKFVNKLTSIDRMTAALILLVVGLIFFLLAGLGAGVAFVWTLGAIMFFLGIVLLLIEFL